MILMLLFILQVSYGQKERKDIRKGNRDYQEENFEEAEVMYRKALEDKPDSYEAAFNLGNSSYKQEKYEEAMKEFQSIANNNISKKDKAKT